MDRENANADMHSFVNKTWDTYFIVYFTCQLLLQFVNNVGLAFNIDFDSTTMHHIVNLRMFSISCMHALKTLPRHEMCKNFDENFDDIVLLYLSVLTFVLK